MNTFARILASCSSIALLSIASVVHADRPAMDEHDGTPLAPPESMAMPEAPAHASEMPAAEEPPVQQTTGTVLNTAPVTASPGENLSAAVHLLDFPRRGMSMDKVQNELGQPLSKVPAVGEPPISRWNYNDRTVYFEGSSVIHVVATK